MTLRSLVVGRWWLVAVRCFSAAAVLMIASFYFLSLAVRTLPIGTAYAVWTGIGTVGAALLGMVLFDEPRDVLRVLCILLIIGGIAGLKITSTT